MNRPKATNNLCNSAKSKIAVLALSALSATGCKASFCFKISTAEATTEEKADAAKESTRAAAVDDDGSRVITVSDAGVNIILRRIELEDCRSKIEALMNFSKHSPIRHQEKAQKYSLSKGASPWGELDVQAFPTDEGGISIITKNGRLALSFKCESLDAEKDVYFCEGDEIDSEKLKEKQVVIAKKLKHKKEVEAEKEKQEELARQAEKEDEEEDEGDGDEGEGEKKAEEENEDKKDEKAGHDKGAKVVAGNHPAVEGNPNKYSLRPDIDAMLRQLEPQLKGLNIEKRKTLAFKLAGEKWKSAVEEDIKEYEQNSGAGKMLNEPTFLIATIKYVLATEPDLIVERGKELGVELVDLPAFGKLVNELRAEKKLPPLNYGESTQKMAEYWAKHPKAPAGGHEADGETPDTRRGKFGFGLAVENVSWPNNFDAAHIFQQWKDSPDHYNNMINPDITEMGLRCVKGTGVKSDRFCVMVGTAPKNTKPAIVATDAQVKSEIAKYSDRLKKFRNDLQNLLVQKTLRNEDFKNSEIDPYINELKGISDELKKKKSELEKSGGQHEETLQKIEISLKKLEAGIEKLKSLLKN